MASFYSQEELLKIGFHSVGEDVKISRNCSIYTPQKIDIGNHVRIDDFCIISGSINIGNYVHVAAACLLFGGDDGIVMEDFTAISSRSALYAESDDYSGCALSNPMVPEKYRKIYGGGIVMKKHSIIGTGCTVLPGVVIGQGCSVGAMSLINKSINSWGIYIGVPCHFVKDRKKDLLKMEQDLLKERITNNIINHG